MTRRRRLLQATDADYPHRRDHVRLVERELDRLSNLTTTWLLRADVFETRGRREKAETYRTCAAELDEQLIT